MTLSLGPGILAVSGAAIQEPTVAEAPLPGGVAAVLRFFFNLPQWLQITGAIAGVLVAIVVVVLAWRRRRDIGTWLATRPRPLKVALGAAAGVALVVAIAGGLYGYNYIQHDNGFCTGCHVMGSSYQRFTQSEHAQLQCHDCHQQSMFASMRQLYLWVAERPAGIGPHAKVQTQVCARCHVTGEPEVWQRIASTAGHRTHLESDAPALRGVQCVTCHGVEVHHFAPLDKTCAQAGCHAGTEIALGEMRGQTALHCTACHRFTAEVPALATRDSAQGALVPGERQCFSCHQMRERLDVMNMDPSRDPHAGTCGMCHNPHRQTQVAAAAATCASSGCHSDWRKVPFHTGTRHRTVSQNCTLCHLPHQARVDPSDCAGCHQSVRQRSGGRLTPPLPFDTSSVRPEVSSRVPIVPYWSAPPRGKGDARMEADPPVAAASAQPPDSFPHARHTTFACITCHTTRTGHGNLTFVAPRGCQLCHHQKAATADCAACHDTLRADAALALVIGAAGRPGRERAVAFQHTTHQAVRCVQCHDTPVSLVPSPANATCRSCHADHHTERRACSACHGNADPRGTHASFAEFHVGCDKCHGGATVARLVPDRSFCLTCHADRREHEAGRECTTCHFLASPEQFRPLLRKVEGDG